MVRPQGGAVRLRCGEDVEDFSSYTETVVLSGVSEVFSSERRREQTMNTNNVEMIRITLLNNL